MDHGNQELISFSKDLPVLIKIYNFDTPNRHWHPVTELLFVLSGEADMIVEDRSFHVVPEDIILINRNALHEIVGERCAMLSITFRMDELTYLDNTDDIYFELNSAGETRSGRYHYIRHLMAQIVKVNASGENKYLTLSLLYAIISHLMDNFRGVAPVNVPVSYKFRDRMAGILNYIEEHYREGVTLSELAQTQNLSVSYFASFFEKNVGMTFLTYYNNLRLNYAVNEMLSSDEPLETIALSNGFRDSRSFVTLFKKKYDCLPSIYRKKFGNIKNVSRNDDVAKNQVSTPSPSNYAEDGNELKNLAKYLSIYEENGNFKYSTKEVNLRIDAGNIDYHVKGIPLSHNYKNMCCVGSAKQFLYSEVQEMLRTVQNKIHFKYVKFHGILSDEMMVYMEKEDGTPAYSFAMIDKVLDFLLSINLRPLVQLSFMPQALASDPSKLIYMWNFNTSPPKDIKKWTDLVTAVIQHTIRRYGLDEVKKWLFCVWNEPDGSVDSFGWKEPNEFYNFYKETYLAVKAIDPGLMFGTPSLLLQPDSDQKWTTNFFEYSTQHNCIADFLNIHYYDNSFPNYENSLDAFNFNNIVKPSPLNVDPFALTKFINQLKIHNKKYRIANMPIYLTEWNLTVSHRDLINDTCFKSCYLMKNLLENYDRLQSFGYWCLTDFIEELQLPNELYHGGLGMFTYNGIPKAHYNTFKFLTHLGNEMLAKGNGYFVTRDGHRLIIILYNYEHYSKLFASGILFDMTSENRYAAFTQMNQAQFQIKFLNLPSKGCVVKELYVNQNQGSSYDAWARMGAQPFTSAEDIEILKQISQPGLFLHHETIEDGALILRAEMEPLEVRLIELILDEN